jgi:type II secretory pathway pseudopilin PulG
MIELVIALFVSATIFAGVLPLIFNAINNNKVNKLKINAYEAAEKELEIVKSQDFSVLTTHTFTANGIPGGNGNLTVTKVYPDLADVTSKVSWTFNGRNQEVELRTYIYGNSE